MASTLRVEILAATKDEPAVEMVMVVIGREVEVCKMVYSNKPYNHIGALFQPIYETTVR